MKRRSDAKSHNALECAGATLQGARASKPLPLHLLQSRHLCACAQLRWPSTVEETPRSRGRADDRGPYLLRPVAGRRRRRWRPWGLLVVKLS